MEANVSQLTCDALCLRGTAEAGRGRLVSFGAEGNVQRETVGFCLTVLGFVSWEGLLPAQQWHFLVEQSYLEMLVLWQLLGWPLILWLLLM